MLPCTQLSSCLPCRACCLAASLAAEICSTPSDVGIFEVAHNKCRGPDGKFSWKKVSSGCSWGGSVQTGLWVLGVLCAQGHCLQLLFHRTEQTGQ